MGKLKYDAKRRRALNIVWDVSWDYRFDPDFLAYTEQGTPDLYLNAVVGFTRKYYDVKLIHQMFEEMEDSALRDTFTDLFWLGLEYATYAKEAPVRPVLPYLRQQHARAYFDGTKLDKTGVAHEMQAARWHEVLGEGLDLHDPWAKGLYANLCFDPAWDTKQLCDHFRKITKSTSSPISWSGKAWKKSSSAKAWGTLSTGCCPMCSGSRKACSIFSIPRSRPWTSWPGKRPQRAHGHYHRPDGVGKLQLYHRLFRRQHLPAPENAGHRPGLVQRAPSGVPSPLYPGPAGEQRGHRGSFPLA